MSVKLHPRGLKPSLQLYRPMEVGPPNHAWLLARHGAVCGPSLTLLGLRV